MQCGHPFPDLSVDSLVGKQSHVTETAQSCDLDVTVDGMRRRAARCNESIAEKPAERMFAVFGQTGTEEAKSNMVVRWGIPCRTRSASEILDPLAAAGGDLAERRCHA